MRIVKTSEITILCIVAIVYKVFWGKKNICITYDITLSLMEGSDYHHI